MNSNSQDLEWKTNWNELQYTLRNQLRPYGFYGSTLQTRYKHHHRHLVEMVKRTAVIGESNSCLIIGPRGSGKSALFESVKTELYKHSDVKRDLIFVNLNGLIHTDDHSALKDIARQLKLENIVGDKVFGSFAEKLTFLLAVLKSGSQQSKSILIALDEFDLFCHHKNQTLLYNLFDVALSGHSPLCIIGLSCRLDVIQLLEKRVKSRFSHRQIYLLEKIDFTEYIDIAKELLSLPDDFSDAKFKDEWNSQVKDILQQITVRDVLNRLFEYSRDIRDLKRLLLLPVSLIKYGHPFLETGDFIDSYSVCFADSKAAILRDLSILEISLVIAMMHLTEIYEGEPFNFEMIYHEYQKFAQKKTMLQNFNKAVIMKDLQTVWETDGNDNNYKWAIYESKRVELFYDFRGNYILYVLLLLKAYEHLQAMELVKPVERTSINIQKQYRLVRLLVDQSQVKMALQQYPNLPTQLQQWASSAYADI